MSGTVSGVPAGCLGHDDDDDDDDFDVDNRKKATLAQTIDQVMTIKTHTESSKTELSSGGKRPFKVWCFLLIFSTETRSC